MPLLRAGLSARFPSQFNFCSVDIGALHLSVGTRSLSTVGVVPGTCSLRLVSIEVSLEIGAVRVNPLAGDEFAFIEFSNVLLASLEHNVGSLAVLLAFGPLAGEDILVFVSHDTLATAASG